MDCAFKTAFNDAKAVAAVETFSVVIVTFLAKSFHTVAAMFLECRHAAGRGDVLPSTFQGAAAAAAIIRGCVIVVALFVNSENSVATDACTVLRLRGIANKAALHSAHVGAAVRCPCRFVCVAVVTGLAVSSDAVAAHFDAARRRRQRHITTRCHAAAAAPSRRHVVRAGAAEPSVFLGA